MSPHALARYREQHPAAELGHLRGGVTQGKVIDPVLVWSLTGRRGEAMPTDYFVLAPDGWGVFVLCRHPDHEVVKTYLRFSQSQASIALGLPKGSTPAPPRLPAPEADAPTEEVIADTLRDTARRVLLDLEVGDGVAEADIRALAQAALRPGRAP